MSQAPRASSVSLITTLLITGCASPLPTGGGTTVVPVSSATFATSSSAVAAAAMTYDRIADDDGPPMSLTGTDGSGMVLARVDAKAVVEGPLAFTELHLWFHNAEARVREGRFAITLPPGAALSRFAMENDGNWMEAEVVEKMAARRAYEDFLHHKQDPALLEKAAGNEFSARVFPIPASGDKHLVISYSQELASSASSYVLPLRGLPSIARVDAKVRVARADRAALAWDESTLSQTGWKPDRDFVVPVTEPIAAIASGDWLATRVMVPEGGGVDDRPSSLAILVDTSASRALGFARQVDQVGELLAAVAQKYGGQVEVNVAAFDQDVLPIYRGRADGWTEKEKKASLARQPLGASSLAAAMGWVATAGMKRVVLIGDGVVTAGADGDALLASIKALGKAGVERMDAVLVGGIRDVDAARTWVSAGLARDGAVIDLGSGTGEAARRLGLAVRSDLTVAVRGATWSWPDRAVGVQPGDELVVYAKGTAAGTRTIDVGGQGVEVTPVGSTGPLLARAAAEAEVARMERDLARTTDAKAKATLADAIVKKSVATRVMSSLTSFLVLETEADYARFGIARTALADILVVGADGLQLAHRAAPVLIVAPVVVPASKGKGKVTTAKPGWKVAEEQGDHYESLRLRAEDDAAKEDAKVSGLKISLPGGETSEEQMVDDDKKPADLAVSDPMLAADPTPAIPRPPAMVAPVAPPPPPPPAPRPTHGNDDSDGTGTAMTLEEGRMGRGGDANMALDSRPGPDDGEDTTEQDEEKNSPPALDGRLAKVMQLITSKQGDAAMIEALSWHREQPGDVLGLIALGEALEAGGDRPLAARAYGSLIDLFPGRADLRRFAGERLERLAEVGRDLAIDTYQHAVTDRPDHLTGHRLLAMALVRAGRIPEAFAAIEHGLAQSYPPDRFRGGERILREDLGLIGAAWLAKEPGKKAEITKRLAAVGAAVPTRSSLRFILYWETDANDVDFHIRDSKHGHAWYSHKQLASGGELYEDVTTGYGPEEFTIEGEPRAYPYKLKIHYYSRGPMGYGMGVLEIMRHDGKGHLTFEHRPYIAMNDHAYVDLGTVAK